MSSAAVFVFLKQESQKKEFADKLELLLYRAYNLQEEFGSSLSTDNLLLDLGEQSRFANSGRNWACPNLRPGLSKP